MKTGVNEDGLGGTGGRKKSRHGSSKKGWKETRESRYWKKKERVCTVLEKKTEKNKREKILEKNSCVQEKEFVCTGYWVLDTGYEDIGEK